MERCDFEIFIPFRGFCKIGFSYPVEYDGTRNYCIYTGGASGCSYHECKKNQ